MSGRGWVQGWGARPTPSRAGSAVGRALSAHPWLASLVFVALWWILVLPHTEAASFTAPTDPDAEARAWLLRIACALCLLVLVRWALHFGSGVLRGDTHYRVWLRASLLYLAVQILLLTTTWPGHWVWDEFDVVYQAGHYWGGSWQGFLTNVYYTFSMYLLPSAVGIVLVQTVFVALVAGYAVAVLGSRLHRPHLAYLVIVPLLAPAVLLNNLYPLRLTAYGYLLVLVIVHVLRRRTEKGPTRGNRNRIGEFFALSIAIGLLAFWRSEGVAFLALLPIAFIALRPDGPGPDWKRAGAALLLGVSSVGSLGWLVSATTDPTYGATAMINPLSTMLQQPLEGPRVAEDLQAVNAVVSVDAMRAHPSYTEIPAVWQVGWQPQAGKYVDDFRAAFIDLVVHNPGPFIDNRLHAFAAANGQEDHVPQVTPEGLNGSEPWKGKFTTFERENRFASMWNAPLKFAVERQLMFLTPDLQPTLGTRIFWNSSPSIVLLTISTIWAAARRRRIIAGCLAAVLASAALIFLSEPGSNFMYFFPVVLCGSVVLGAAAALVLDRRIARRAASTSAAALPSGERAGSDRALPVGSHVRTIAAGEPA